MENSNFQPPLLNQSVPNYPVHIQVLRVTSAVPVSISGGLVYSAYTEQGDSPISFRDREPCFAIDPNGTNLGAGYYLGRLVGSFTNSGNTYPLYAATAISGNISGGVYDISSYRAAYGFGFSFYPPGLFSGQWQATSALTANRTYAFPFILPLKTTFAEVSAWVADATFTGFSPGRCYVGVYHNEGWNTPQNNILYPYGVITQGYLSFGPANAYDFDGIGFYLNQNNGGGPGIIGPNILDSGLCWLVWNFDSNAASNSASAGIQIGAFKTDNLIPPMGVFLGPAGTSHWQTSFGWFADQTAGTFADPDPFTGSDLSVVRGSQTIPSPLIIYSNFDR